MLHRHPDLTTTVCLFLLALLLALPAPLRAEEPAAAAGSSSGNSLLDEALALYADGAHGEALPKLLFLLESADEVTPMLEARLAVARIHLQRGENELALAQLARIPATRRTDRSRLLEGEILLVTGRLAEGVATLKRVDAASLPQAERAQLLAALAHGSADLGETFPALWFVHRALQASDDPRQQDEVYALAQRLLAADEIRSQLPEIGFMFADTAIGAAAGLQQVEQLLAVGDRDVARARIGQVDIGLVPGSHRQQAIALFTELTGENWLQRSIGVVLPLSGKYAVYGDFVRRGMELALETMPNEAGVRFLFYDGAGDAGQSRNAVRTLIRGEKVVALTGAITGAAAAEIAEEAQSERVPLLALSQRESLPETGAYVFRSSLTARQQVETLARYAVLEQGMTSFGVLYPENRLGRNMSELFAAAVEALGGEVVALQGYADSANDFGPQIRQLKGESPYRVEQQLSDAELLADLFVPDPPPVEFEALFIPDYADRISVIAPQLVYYGIEDVPLLGINGWNAPEQLKTVSRFIDGAVFVDGFFAYSPFPFVKEFVDRYFEKYGEMPTYLQAQGYDAAGILLTLLENPRVRTRDDLRRSLGQLQAYPGVTGATSFNLVGEAEKVLYLLQMRRGNIEQLNTLPSSEPPPATIESMIDRQLLNE